MQGLLARLNKQKSTTLDSNRPSRSASIASSMDNDEDQQSTVSGDESTQKSDTLKPKVSSERKKKPGYNSSKEVSKPTPKSRIDTNMVKLKLLDATRKAIIDKTNKPAKQSQYTQTDTIKTKLCRDVSVDNQSELVHPVDAQTETDVELVAFKAADGRLIVTTSVAMNTDEISKNSMSTQTVMPRSNVAFKKILEPKHKLQYLDDEEDEEASDFTEDPDIELLNLEKKFKAKSKKKLTRQKSQGKQSINIVIEDESADVIAIETIPAESPTKGYRESESEYEEIHEEIYKPRVMRPRERAAPKEKSDDAYNNWHDLDFPQSKVELPRSYFTEGPTPWSNFQDLILGQRFLNARLSPIQPRQPPLPGQRHVTWSESQVKLVNDLIREANALLDMFDQVAMLLGPDIKLHNVSDVEEFHLPPSKYGEEMAKSCEKLEESLRKIDELAESRNHPENDDK